MRYLLWRKNFKILGGCVNINYEACNSILNWLENNCPLNEIDYLSKLDAIRLAEQVLKSRDSNVLSFSEILVNFASDKTQNDPYQLKRLYENSDNLMLLLKEIQQSDFVNKTLDYVKGFFPKEFVFSEDINIYFTFNGWIWGDAQFLNYEIKDEKIVLNDLGKMSTLFFNLSCFYKENNKLEDILNTFRGVFAHELFHCYFDEYNKFYNKKLYLEDKNYIYYLMLNEGIAHHITYQLICGNNIQFLDKYFSRAVEKFNLEMIDYDLFSEDEYKNFIENGTSGENKFISFTGFHIINEIYKRSGVEGLNNLIIEDLSSFIDLSKNN